MSAYLNLKSNVLSVVCTDVKRDDFVKPGADIDGVNLLCVLNTTACKPSIVHRGEGHPYLYWRSGHYKSLRYYDWKISVADLPRKVWLFDLHNDFAERSNIAEGLNVDVLRVWTANNCFEDKPSNQSLASIAGSTSSHSLIRRNPYEMVPQSIDDNYYRGDEVFQHWITSTRSKIEALGPVDEDSSMLTRLQFTCNLLRILDRVDAEQTSPLWPSVSETVVRVDEPSFLEGTSDGWNARIGDEYIYWPN